ncbi:leucine-rich melanocyte differentiation-associated protein-like [Chelonus insularis]|uniref:leucine-rich melanocyte differentiation-associated protein-like n=1 Tax=Chelonus insularis TaxID=460826 RepID=UPI00158E0FE9|nr:leucine-rich melanocyte differentiation-associated protein-like [Chelonus insularis]
MIDLKMARNGQQDFNRSALIIMNKRVCYTGQRISRIPAGLVKIVGANCVTLDLSYNQLTSISALKDYGNLQELILDNNKLRDLKTLPYVPALTTISLNNNELSDIDAALEKIKNCCPNIKYVSLLGNPGYPDQLTDPVNNDEADYDRYRLYAIHILPDSLRFLDFRPVTLIERKDACDRGRFLRTIKLSTSSSVSGPQITPMDNIDAILNTNYSPLPTSNRSPHDHKGAYGKCRYRYSGKNSEGNRFIINSDL